MIGGTLTILTEVGAVLEIFRQEPGQPSVLIADNQGTAGVYDLTVDAKDVVGKPGYKTYFLLLSDAIYKLGKNNKLFKYNKEDLDFEFKSAILSDSQLGVLFAISFS